MKWPKSCEKAVWEKVNVDLSNLMGTLQGTTLKKLDCMGELIYTYGAEQFGTYRRRKAPTIPTMSKKAEGNRWPGPSEKAIEEALEEATEEERDGINVLHRSSAG